MQEFAGFTALLATQTPLPDTLVSTREETADGVPVRIYTPPAASGGKTLPVGVYYHGGGYLLEDLDSEDAFCRHFAKNTPCVIVSVDYRLSSVAKMPAGLEDSITAYKWVCGSSLYLAQPLSLQSPSSFRTLSPVLRSAMLKGNIMNL